MVTSQTQRIGGGFGPQKLSLLMGWLIAIAAFCGLCFQVPWRVAVAAPASPPTAEASDQPQYNQLPLDEELKSKHSAQRSEVARILRNSQFGPNDQPVVEDYYNKYALPRWTLIEFAAPRVMRPDSMTLLGFRKELQKELANAQGQIHEFLSTLVLNFMTQIVNGNFHPNAQVNAALMIGELDAEKSTAPLPKALPVLIRIVQDAKVRDPVRAEAMVGIIRHAEPGVGDDAARSSIAAAMLKLLASEITSGLTAQGQMWIRGQALEALGRLGSPGENGEVVKAIVTTLGDADSSALVGPALSYTTRCMAAKALGRLNYTGAKGVNVAEAASALGQLCAQVCDDGLRITKIKGASTVGRRALAARLNAILVGLRGTDEAHKGILSLADAQQKESLAELQTFLDLAMEVVNNPKSDVADVDEAATKLHDSVTGWLQKQST
jgi:hypothetical protein